MSALNLLGSQDPSVMDRARMLVGISESLGLPLDGRGGSDLNDAIGLARLERLCKGDELLFELRTPDGHSWKLYLDGRIEGFPEGALLQNYALPLVNALVGEVLGPIKIAVPCNHS